MHRFQCGNVAASRRPSLISALTVCALTLTSSRVLAQNNTDQITLRDGSRVVGKITSVNPNVLTVTVAGDTQRARYTLLLRDGAALRDDDGGATEIAPPTPPHKSE